MTTLLEAKTKRISRKACISTTFKQKSDLKRQLTSIGITITQNLYPPEIMSIENIM